MTIFVEKQPNGDQVVRFQTASGIPCTLTQAGKTIAFAPESVDSTQALHLDKERALIVLNVMDSYLNYYDKAEGFTSQGVFFTSADGKEIRVAYSFGRSSETLEICSVDDSEAWIILVGGDTLRSLATFLSYYITYGNLNGTKVVDTVESVPVVEDEMPEITQVTETENNVTDTTPVQE